MVDVDMSLGGVRALSDDVERFLDLVGCVVRINPPQHDRRKLLEVNLTIAIQVASDLAGMLPCSAVRHVSPGALRIRIDRDPRVP